MNLNERTEWVRGQFPQLEVKARGKRLVYLDSAATSLKPRAVIEAVNDYLSMQVSNVHRGAHYLADRGTERFEGVRDHVSRFIGAENRNEIVFTRGTTEGINLVAASWGRAHLQEGDEILVSQMEHHSNIVPWQMIAAERKAVVRFVPVLDDGTLDFAGFKRMLSIRTRIVSLVHLSNVLGTMNPLARFFAEARKVGALTLADAAQSIVAAPIRVKELGCDFLTFSGHKMFASTGVGVLYGRQSLLESMPPYQGGGSMIADVKEDGISFLPPPQRFEAGTPPVAEVISLGAALEFIEDLGFDWIRQHEQQLMAQAEEGLRRIGGIRRLGAAADRGHILSFLVEGHHPADFGVLLDEQGVAVRTGHHCCQPLMRRFGIPGTIRASFSVYTSEEDIHDFLIALNKAKDMLL
jgi:cysteine desulfurase/selenocysteine lyase